MHCHRSQTAPSRVFGGTASAAAIRSTPARVPRRGPRRVGRRNCARPVRTLSLPRRSSAGFVLGHAWHTPTGVTRSARITGCRIAAMRTGPAQLGIPAGRSPTGDCIRCRPAALQSAARSRDAPEGLVPGRRTALLIGAPSEPRDRRQNQNTPGGGADGVGDEYAISAAANPEADQSAHRRSIHRNRRRGRKSGAGGRVLPRGEAARRAEGPSGALRVAAERDSA
jgi:hypothetical protein